MTAATLGLENSGRVAKPGAYDGSSMTHLLQRAFSEAAKLSQEEQDLLAARMLAELEAEDAFDLAIKDSARKIAGTSRTPLR